jgi:hypothetical protein
MTIPFWKHGSFFSSMLYQLGKMEAYVDLIQFAVFNETPAYKKLIAETWTNDEKAELYDEDIEAYDELWITKRDEEFREILYTGFLINWYSFIEDGIFLLRNKLSVQNDLGLRSRYVGSYEITKDHWDELKFTQKLRNRVVHYRGRLHFVTSNTPQRSSLLKRKGFIKTRLTEFDNTTIWINKGRYVDASTCAYMNKYGLIQLVSGGLRIVPNVEYSRHLIGFGKSVFLQIHNDLFRSEQ